MGILSDSATTVVKETKSVLTEIGSATGLSTITDSISNALSSIGSIFTELPGLSLPLPNPLHAYATYDYILGIGVLTDEDLNNPDTTYMIGKSIPLICKSANAEPSNRINTPYGKFDFFIDNLKLDQVIGHENGNNTNVTTFSFDIIEPYSMGLFGIACQQAAFDAGHDNWRSAPFLLSITFRGNTENGAMRIIPTTTRYIPFKFSNLHMKVTEAGARYACDALVYNQDALVSKNASLKSDVSISGTTVQEILQTGEKSLQAVINKRNQQLKKDGLVKVPDEVLILFPTNVASDPALSTASSNSENNTGATVHTIDTTNSGVIQKLGVSRSSVNDTLVQAADQCNEFGKASLGFDESRKGDSPFGKENKIYDPEKKTYIRIDNVIKSGESDFRFRQDTDIINAINQVLLQSDYPLKALEPSRISPEGFRQWWKVDVQTYNITTNENMTSTGTKPRLFVYRVVPYYTHLSSAPLPANTKPPGFEQLANQIVKQYNYIYTGKNIDVLSFDLNFDNTFSTILAADGGKESMDVKSSAQTGGTDEQKANAIVLKGKEPEKLLGIIPTQISFSGLFTGTDKLGGGGSESTGTRAARMFHDAVNNTNISMVNVELEILGDPYYIAQSGTGNYTSSPSQYMNLNADGTVNYQSGETDIVINFRTPLDINQRTGLYNFGSQSNTTPVMQFSGFYRVTNVISRFSGGKFTQILSCQRRDLQEASVTSTPEQLFSTSNFVKEIDDAINNVTHILEDTANGIVETINGELSSITKSVNDTLNKLF